MQPDESPDSTDVAGPQTPNVAMEHYDIWTLPVVLLWLLFMLVGLVPEPVYVLIRDLGRVQPQTALVNSPVMVTVAFSMFFALFVRRKCCEHGGSIDAANARASQVWLLCFFAFLGFGFAGPALPQRSVLGLFLMHATISDGYLRWVAILAGGAKICSWWYLMTLLVRYYLFGNRTVFLQMFAVSEHLPGHDSRDRG